jgi:hypothetical protein
MLKLCVTEESAINVTFVMLVAFGVPTKNELPYPTLPGADEIVGRAPLNRYGGEYTSADIAGAVLPPADKTRPSGNRSAME